MECNPLLDELPTVSETVKAIKLLSSGKAPGSDEIPAEIYKAGGPPVAEKLSYFTLCGEKKPSLKNGIPIRCRYDGKLYKLRRLQAKSKVQTEVLDEFLFADDMAKVLQQKRKCKKGVDQVSDSCDSYDLTISIRKTEVVYQPAPGKPYKEPTITVKGQRLQVVDKFTYFGSTLSRVVHIDDKVNARIAKASAEFGRLRRSIWDRSGIRLDTKLKVYRSVVLPTLLYYKHTKLGQFTNGMPKD